MLVNPKWYVVRKSKYLHASRFLNSLTTFHRHLNMPTTNDAEYSVTIIDIILSCKEWCLRIHLCHWSLSKWLSSKTWKPTTYNHIAFLAPVLVPSLSGIIMSHELVHHRYLLHQMVCYYYFHITFKLSIKNILTHTSSQFLSSELFSFTNRGVFILIKNNVA